MVTAGSRFELLARSLPLAGVETPSDLIVVRDTGPVVTIAVIDPIGQGAEAREAARAAEQAVRQAPVLGAEAFDRVHQAVAGSAGVALAVLRLDQAEHRLTFLGVGRVYGAVAGSIETVLTSEPGAVGVGMVKVPAPVILPLDGLTMAALAADGPIDTWDLRQVWRSEGADLKTVLRRMAVGGRLPEDGSVVLVAPVG